jgi:methylglyoxal synthase
MSSSGMPPTGMSGCSSKPRQSRTTSNSSCSLTRLPCSATKQKGQTKSDQIRTGIAMHGTLIGDMIPRMIATPKTAAPSMEIRKRVALVAHDHKKEDLLDWARFNQGTLSRHELFGTGTTGKLIHDRLGLDVHRLLSGPLGGDQQLGALIAEGKLDVLIFFWDPLEPQPHDTDVKALLRIAVLYNIPTACNRATADFIVSSHLMAETYGGPLAPGPAPTAKPEG